MLYFPPILHNGLQVWGQCNDKYLKNIFTIQKNALRIMSFSEFRAHSSPLFKTFEILKIEDQVTLSNCLLVHDYLKGKLPQSFENTFKQLKDLNSVSTRNTTSGCLFIPSVSSTRYGINSIVRKSIISWNKFANIFKTKNICNMSRNELKTQISKYFLSTY